MDDVLKRLDKKGFLFSCTYLQKKDTKNDTGTNDNGTIGICILYSCYQDRDPNDKPTSILNENSNVIFPRKTGGMSADATLPMTAMEVDNPLFCPKMAEYFRFWSGRVALWSNAIIDLIEEASNKFLFSSSQGIEGLINQEKTLTSTHKQDMSSIPALIARRWDDCFNGSRYLVKQIIGLGHSIECKEARRLGYETSGNATKRISKLVCGATDKDDRLGVVNCDRDTNNGGDLSCIGGDEVGGCNSEMIWRRTGKKKTKKSMVKIANELMEYQKKLEMALTRGKEMGKFNYNEKSLRSKWSVVKDHVVVMEGNKDSFMGQVKFNEWYKGDRESALKPSWIDTINHFFEMYGAVDISDRE